MYWALPLMVNGIPMDTNVNVEITFSSGNVTKLNTNLDYPKILLLNRESLKNVRVEIRIKILIFKHLLKWPYLFSIFLFLMD